MTTTASSNRDDVLRRVQKLLDKAASTTFAEERASLLAKADSLMTAYAIEQFEIDAARPKDQRERPVVVEVVAPKSPDYRVNAYLNQAFRSLARHCKVLIGRGHDSQRTQTTWKVVGYDTDVRYLQMLYIAVQMNLVSTMAPSVDPSLPEVENYAALRDAGMPISEILPKLGHDYYLPGYRPNGSRNTNRTVIARLRKQYRRLCEATGVEYVEGPTGEAYRLSFLQAFTTELDARLRAMSNERDEATSGHALVVADRSAETENLLWETWPEMAPHPAGCECDACHGICRDASCTRPRCVEYRTAKPVRYAKGREIRWDARAAAKGRAAAKATDLSRGKVQGGTSGSLPE